LINSWSKKDSMPNFRALIGINYRQILILRENSWNCLQNARKNNLFLLMQRPLRGMKGNPMDLEYLEIFRSRDHLIYLDVAFWGIQDHGTQFGWRCHSKWAIDSCLRWSPFIKQVNRILRILAQVLEKFLGKSSGFGFVKGMNIYLIRP